MLVLEYNNFIGSGWCWWEDYRIDYARRHRSSSTIDNFPKERPHMFRIKDTETDEVVDYTPDFKIGLPETTQEYLFGKFMYHTIEIMKASKVNPLNIFYGDDLYNKLDIMYKQGFKQYVSGNLRLEVAFIQSYGDAPMYTITALYNF